ncbi:MAG: hypothetical protein VX460_10785 [Planctomycetota bacterium]|nr:hypothetical protein [Planctomycetota bacterium]
MLRTHLTTLDRALLRLLAERARLCATASSSEACAPSIEDLLRRADGDFDAARLTEVFEAIHAGSAPAPRR